MALSFSNPRLLFQVLATLIALSSVTKFVSANYNFYWNTEIIWGGKNVRYQNGGEVLALSMNKESGSGFQSRFEYLFGKFTMQIKLVKGNSAGSVTTYYFASIGENHDEVDFEFLGNTSGNPYILHTNIFAQGKGDREVQFYLWFDPTADYHNYTLLWNPDNLVFFVDDLPIRIFKNNMAHGVPFPHDQPMRTYCSIWNAEGWATQGGRVKTNWALAPFTAYYREFSADACYPAYDYRKCHWSPVWAPAWFSEQPNWAQQGVLKWVNDNFKIYDYCTDYKRFPAGLPAECTLP